MVGVRLISRASASAVALACLIGARMPDAGAAASAEQERYVSAKIRLEAIRRAQVWHRTNVAAMDIRRGPAGADAFTPNQLVVCDYQKRPLTGRSPKFWCALEGDAGDNAVKVKYGAANGEVFAEVAATRLLWALGFPADRMYPVRVECRGCPASLQRSGHASGTSTLFDPASIERKMDGKAIETSADSGWEWRELDLVDESAGGAPRAQRDALKLLAVLLQHTDSKAAQQRLLCAKTKKSNKNDRDDGAVCAQPVMMLNDLGMTFGRANLFNRNLSGSVNLEEWANTPIWKDPVACIGNLAVSQTGTLDSPRILEAGRKFLADLLLQLSDAQLRDLFDVARFADRQGTKRAATADEWAAAFKRKRDEIVNRTCPF
jgi:hypothetical protein